MGAAEKRASDWHISHGNHTAHATFSSSNNFLIRALLAFTAMVILSILTL